MGLHVSRRHDGLTLSSIKATETDSAASICLTARSANLELSTLFFKETDTMVGFVGTGLLSLEGKDLRRVGCGRRNGGAGRRTGAENRSTLKMVMGKTEKETEEEDMKSGEKKQGLISRLDAVRLMVQ